MKNRLLHTSLVTIASFILYGCTTSSESNTAPTAAFSISPVTGSVDTTFTFDASGCSDVEDDTEHLKVKWDWESDGTWDTDWSVNKIETHQYSTEDSYTITLEVLDTAGLPDSTSKTLVVTTRDYPPIASFIVTPTSGWTGTVFQFDASSISDRETPYNDLEVRWDWENDGTWDTAWDTTKTALHQYLAVGSYTAVLEVSDLFNPPDATDRQISVLENTAPTADFYFSPSSGNLLTQWTFDASISTDNEEPTSALEVRWDWESDGTWDTVWDTIKVVVHKFSEPDDNLVSLEVRDSGGLVASTSQNVHVDRLLWIYDSGATSGINSCPAIASDGTIIVSDRDGYVHAISPDGYGLWTSNAVDVIISASVAVGHDDTIYVAGEVDGNFLTLSPTGDVLWSFQAKGGIKSSPAIGSDGSSYFSCDHAIPYEGPEDRGCLYALNSDGSIKWEDIRLETTASPAIGSDGTIYQVARGNVWSLQPDGTTNWNTIIDTNTHSSPAIGGDGTIYVGNSAGELIAISNTGTILWRYQAESRIHSSPAIGSDGTIYVGSDDGYLYAISTNGNLLWRFDASSQVWSSPAVGANGIIYFASRDVYGVNPDGSLEWEYPLNVEITSSPNLADDGTLYIGTREGYIYAISTSSQGLADSPWPKFRANASNTGRIQP